MLLFKNVLSKSVSLALISAPIAAFASLTIITDSGRSEVIPQSNSSTDIFKQVVNIGDKKFVNHPVDSFASELPLGAVLPSILPSGWSSDITDELSVFPVTWEKSGNWDDVLVEISKRHDLVVLFDWNRNIVSMKANDAELLDISDINIPSFDDTKGDTKVTSKPVFNTVAVVATEDKKITDSLVVCTESAEDTCSSQKVDIEKLVLDTEWLNEESPEPKQGNNTISDNDSSLTVVGEENTSKGDLLTQEQIKKLELERHEKELSLALERDKKQKIEYQNAYILHGDGSYENFVNSGGVIKQADPEKEYVYVFRKGKLFETINVWSELNGYHVENEILQLKSLDYPNNQEIKIKGKYKDVVTLLLNKYRKASTPVNHTYYIGGGAKSLYIFESKYESMYVK